MEPNVHYRVHNSPPLIHIPNQMHPVHNFPPHFPKIHSNIISRLRLVLPSGVFLSGFLTKILCAFLVSPIRATLPPHLFFDFITLLTCGEAYKLWSSSFLSLDAVVDTESLNTTSLWKNHVLIQNSGSPSNYPSACFQGMCISVKVGYLSSLYTSAFTIIALGLLHCSKDSPGAQRSSMGERGATTTRRPPPLLPPQRTVKR
jgi:hypothetical protein